PAVCGVRRAPGVSPAACRPSLAVPLDTIIDGLSHLVQVLGTYSERIPISDTAYERTRNHLRGPRRGKERDRAEYRSVTRRDRCRRKKSSRALSPDRPGNCSGTHSILRARTS